jgi:hypothetical protein
VDTFFNNVARTNSFCWFPAHVAAQALREQFWRDYATLKVTRKLNLRKTAYDNDTEKVISGEIRRIRRAQRDDSDTRRLKIGVPYINNLLGHELGSDQSMEAILFSVVIESWTAFEALVADLWFTALDYGPPEWRKRAASRYDKATAADSEPPVSLDLNRIADPQEKYGSFLRDTEKVPFQKMQNIMTA